MSLLSGYEQRTAWKYVPVGRIFIWLRGWRTSSGRKEAMHRFPERWPSLDAESRNCDCREQVTSSKACGTPSMGTCV